MGSVYNTYANLRNTYKKRINTFFLKYFHHYLKKQKPILCTIYKKKAGVLISRVGSTSLVGKDTCVGYIEF